MVMREKNLLKLRKELGLENNVELIFKSTEQEKVALIRTIRCFCNALCNL
jgi:hypothetical protein